MNEAVLKLIREQGILLEKDVFELVNSMRESAAQVFLESITRFSGQKMITKAVLGKNMEFVQNFLNHLDSGEKGEVERVFVRLGISLEIVKEKTRGGVFPKQNEQEYQIFYANTKADKKIEVADFTGHFRARYQQIQKILMQRNELGNLISINKIGSDRQNLSIIGMVSEKRLTKNKNLIVTFEDLTGRINAVIKSDKEEVFKKADELQVDDIVGVKASGSRDILFVHDIFYPDVMIHEKVKFEEDFSIAFLSDMHCGSIRHLDKSMQRFLDWLNSEEEAAKKIKYIFIAGDNIDGVGVFPGQEFSLKLKSLKEQYSLLADYLKQVPKRIIMFMCPGQHDAVRLAEPQPVIGREHGMPLYEIENLFLVTNPSTIKLKEKNKEFNVLMYHGDSIHDFIRGIPSLREMKAHKCPAKAVVHMLKRRHLFPMHSLAVYIPNMEKDPMVIEEVPDVVCTGEVHRLDIENYNGVLIITGSCWQAQTPFEEKVGNVPDPGKVPVLNLKTRELKIFDFLDEEEVKNVK